MKKVLTVSIIIIAVAMLFGACGANTNGKVQHGASEYSGMSYHDVVRELEKAGFTNIDVSVVDDLTSDGSIADGTVEQVIINGDNAFVAGDQFDPEDSVEIIYHIVKKITPPFDSNSIQNQEIVDLAEAFKDSGFVNVETEEVYDLDPDEISDEYINEVAINNDNSFFASDEFPFDGKVKVIRHYPYEKYTVKINVDFVENWFMNKYDVDFKVDGLTEETLEHGKDLDTELRLPEGEYEFEFVSDDDSSVKGSAELTVDCNIEAGYQITCYGSDINVESLYIDRDQELSEGEIKVGYSADSFHWKDYLEVTRQLMEDGFTNITPVPIYDVYFGIWNSVDDTESVSIAGNDNFTRGDVFNKDDPVVIQYHASIEDDPDYVSQEEQQAIEQQNYEEMYTEELEVTSAVIDQSCKDARNYLKEKGYETTYTFEGTFQDFSEAFNDYYTDDEASLYVVTDVSYVDPESRTIEVYINSYENLERLNERQELRNKLAANIDPSVAVSAVELYGKQQYPAGFSINMINGKLAEEPIDENTWFIKYTAEVKYYGQKQTVNCEAKVKGPESNPTVYDFKIY